MTKRKQSETALLFSPRAHYSEQTRERLSYFCKRTSAANSNLKLNSPHNENVQVTFHIREGIRTSPSISALEGKVASNTSSFEELLLESFEELKLSLSKKSRKLFS